MGQFAMAWIVRKDFVCAIRFRHWSGRAGALLFENDAGEALFAVGCHQAHYDLLWESLSDVARLWKRKPRLAQGALFGDWNVELLPTFSSDPYSDGPAREDKHRKRRDALDKFTEAMKVEFAPFLEFAPFSSG